MPKIFTSFQKKLSLPVAQAKTIKLLTKSFHLIAHLGWKLSLAAPAFIGENFKRNYITLFDFLHRKRLVWIDFNAGAHG
jgi:hypothetical protein